MGGQEDPAWLARESHKTPDDQVGKIEAAGVNVAQAHHRFGRAAEEIVALLRI